MNGLDVISVNLTQWAFILLLCHDPRSTFRRLRPSRSPLDQHDRKENSERQNQVDYFVEPYPTKLPHRIPWVLTLLFSLRLVNWTIGDASHDRKQPIKAMSRTKFCRYASLLAVQSFIILDLTSTWAKYDPYFHTTGMGMDQPWQDPLGKSPKYFSLIQALPPRIPRTAVLAGQAYACISQGGSLPVIPIVGLSAIGLWPDEWSPHTWPIFFGRFSALSEKGLRGLWGTWWHQTNRYLSIPGRTLSQKLGISTESSVCYMLQVLSAFFLSGLMHTGMVPPQPLGTPMTAMEMRFYLATFFWMQILGIGFEVVFSRIVGRSNVSLTTSSFGRWCTFLWVTLWLSSTLPLLAIPFRELGYWRYPPIPVSIIGWISGGDWWVWA
ncbi:MAG: hypothetical protein LQ348_006322 [Seirophora lacunosa]|nr:MAG: hypothetical protein LQ348_006322 [Seirophora lacunosa]